MEISDKDKKSNIASIIRGNDQSLVKRTSQLVDRGLALASDLTFQPGFIGHIDLFISRPHQDPGLISGVRYYHL